MDKSEAVSDLLAKSRRSISEARARVGGSGGEARSEAQQVREATEFLARGLVRIGQARLDVLRGKGHSA